MEPVTIVIVNYNSGEGIRETLKSVDQMNYRDVNTIVVDNKSSDRSPDIIRKEFPYVKLIRLKKNMGSAAARNIGIVEAAANLVLLLDDDITIHPDCLRQLCRIKSKLPLSGALHPMIMDKDNPDRPQLYNGGYIHYLCAFIPRESYKTEGEYEIFDTVSSGALLIDKTITEKTGGFDGDFFFNWEDGDFTFRLTISGYPCVVVPSALAYHPLKTRGKSRVYYQVRNRWYFILKIYSWKTLIICSPVFIAYELSQAIFLLVKGALIDYTKGTFMAVIDLNKTLRKRKKVQELKILKDRDIFRADDLYVPEKLLGHKIFRKIKDIYVCGFKFYWEAVKNWL